MQINIGLCFNDSYSQHAGTLMASILENSSNEDSYKFFIISEYISNQNIRKIEKLKSIKDFEYEIMTVNADMFKNIGFYKKINISAFYRFFLFTIKSVDKILYLDSDTIVRHDIRELFETDIEDYYIAGVEDIVGKQLVNIYKLSPTTTYINSGVMLLNLKFLREINIGEEVMNLPPDFTINNFGDQDIINYMIQDKVLPLDLKWNVCYPYKTTYSDENYYHQVAKDPAIFHYITDTKPWLPNKYPMYKKDYFKYLSMTPWFNEFMAQYQIEENTIIMQYLNKIAQKLEI